VNRPRLSARDYKRRRRSGVLPDGRRARDLAVGLAAGLCVAAVIYIADHRATSDAVSADERPTPRRAPAEHGSAADAAALPSPTAADTEDSSSGPGKYQFYQMLPKFEVVVPEKERGTRLAPAAQVDRPGVYFLQVGSYRDSEVAERIRAQLAKLGIDASVQRVAVDADVWHRVRIGPIRDLPRLNHLRQQLQSSDLDSLVVRVDD
jgi:cell division protein FtsN